MKKALREMAEALLAQGKAKVMADFLKDILTPSEVQTIALRWELLKRLLEGKSQRTIAAELGVSLCKITRGSRELHKENSVLKRVIGDYLARRASHMHVNRGLK